MFFGLPGMVGTYGGAWLAKYIPGPVQLVFFAGVMLLASVVMWRHEATNSQSKQLNTHVLRPQWVITVEGLPVGVLTGLVGVGGGFLIVPALVVLGNLDLRRAVGTSLVIIALKSAAGFVKYFSVMNELNITLNGRAILILAAFGVVGSLAGRRLSAYLPVATLQRAFVVFLVLMAIFVLSQEVPRLMSIDPVNPAPAIPPPSTPSED